MQFVAGRMVPKLTANGFEVVDVHKEIFQKLSAAVKRGIGP
jgi:hypothetical protein